MSVGICSRQKLIGSADDPGVDAVVAGAGDGRVGVGAGADDEQVSAICHGALPSSSLP